MVNDGIDINSDENDDNNVFNHNTRGADLEQKISLKIPINEIPIFSRGRNSTFADASPLTKEFGGFSEMVQKFRKKDISKKSEENLKFSSIAEKKSDLDLSKEIDSLQENSSSFKNSFKDDEEIDSLNFIKEMLKEITFTRKKFETILAEKREKKLKP